MKDKLGQEITVGDRVVYYDGAKYGRALTIKTVAGLTKSFVKFPDTFPARAAPWNVVVVESNLRALA